MRFAHTIPELSIKIVALQLVEIELPRNPKIMHRPAQIGIRVLSYLGGCSFRNVCSSVRVTDKNNFPSVVPCCYGKVTNSIPRLTFCGVG